MLPCLLLEKEKTYRTIPLLRYTQRDFIWEYSRFRQEKPELFKTVSNIIMTFHIRVKVGLKQSRQFHQFITKGFSPKTFVSSEKTLAPGETFSANDLLTNLGYISPTGNAGFLHYMPLGERVLHKIMNIIRKELNQKNNISYPLLTSFEKDGNGSKQMVTFPIRECELSSVSSQELWTKTGRFPSDEIFPLRDEKLLLVPTCEEEITQVMKKYITSYKDLPIIMYQIGKKYRYEKRPRGGILRGREFYMKDAYSFHSNDNDAIKCFDYMNEKYGAIFRKFKLPFYQAWADSGTIGGDKSMEFHYVDESIGDDKILICNNVKSNCNHVTNVEKNFGSPNPKKIGATMDNIKIKWCYDLDKESLVCIYYPTNDTLDLKKINFSINGDSTKMSLDLQSFQQDSNFFLQKINREISEEDLLMIPVIRIIDIRINSRATLPEFELKKYSKGQLITLDEVDCCESTEGDICEVCDEGEMELKKTVEVGHIFHLGNKYSNLLKLNFTNDKNFKKNVSMGCYGIGVSRLIGVIAQKTKDNIGLRWPSTIAPYITNFVFDTNKIKKDESIITKFINGIEEQIEINGNNNGNDNYIQDKYYFDIRNDISIGLKIKQSHMVGIPICCIIKNDNLPFVELEIRGFTFNNNIDKKPNYLSLQESLKDEYKWTIVDKEVTTTTKNNNNNKDFFEKHIVHKDHVHKVISIIIKDL